MSSALGTQARTLSCKAVILVRNFSAQTLAETLTHAVLSAWTVCGQYNECGRIV